jgi:hypothetical protein
MDKQKLEQRRNKHILELWLLRRSEFWWIWWEHNPYEFQLDTLKSLKRHAITLKEALAFVSKTDKRYKFDAEFYLEKIESHIERIKREPEEKKVIALLREHGW